MLHSPPGKTGVREPIDGLHSYPKADFVDRRTGIKDRRAYPQPQILERIKANYGDALVLDYLEALGSPRALSVWLLYKYDQHRDLVELSIDPLQYNDPELFRNDYAATKFLSKCIGLKTDIDLKKKAIDSAEEAEIRCKQTNQRIRGWRKGSPHVSAALAGNLFRAQQTIAAILGPVPNVFTDVGWSPGRTSVCSGDEVASIYKYAGQLDVTVSARAAALRLLRDSPHWGASALNADGPCSPLSQAMNVVQGNTMITVPKSAKTDRVICYEPHMNIRLQLAVGSFIRSKLLKRGVNLNDQSINQRRAHEASVSGALATIDLSMASDTLALELVYELLPVDWALLLDSLRSKRTLWPDGTTRLNEKFSSMGNGFTFELESMIFYALASAVTSNVSVFGDDLIFPTEAFEEVSDLLVASGFLVNTRKSFSTSYFRESCGNDVFGGVSCTPVYLRRLPKTKEDVVKLHNAVRAFCGRATKPLLKFAKMLRKWRNIHTCPLGPSGYGDGHYHVEFDEATPRRADFEIDGWWFKSFIRVYRVNRMYGDRVSGRFSERFYHAALCTSLGPKAVRSIFDATADRRQFTYKKQRVLANFTWPGIVWF